LLIFLGFWPAFCAGTMNPFTRYPLFLMGAYAGELCSRQVDNVLYFPASSVFTLFLPRCCCGIPLSYGTTSSVQIDDSVVTNAKTENNEYWTKQVDSVGFSYLFYTLLISLIDGIVRYALNIEGGILGSVWFQAIVPFLQLEFIIALTRDVSEGAIITKFFNHPYNQWLGKISMSIYLIHMPVLYYLCWALNNGKKLEWPESDCTDDDVSENVSDCEDQWENLTRKTTIPSWGIPIVVSVSMVLAVFIYYVIEEPGRKLLRAKK
jgi:hypothetical protein